MSNSDCLSPGDLRFVHDPFHELLGLGLLEDIGALDISEDNQPQNVELDILEEASHLAFFAFYYRHKVEADPPRKWGFIPIGSDHVASVWSDESKLRSPFTSTHIRDQPLRDMPHANGHCMICPAKTFVGNNLGSSPLGTEEGLHGSGAHLSDIEFFDSQEYSMYDYESSEPFERHSRGQCDECQNEMREWFSEQLAENVNYLYGLGGTGLLHTIDINEDEYNILEFIAGREPFADTVIGEESETGELSDRTRTQLDQSSDSEYGPEELFNIVLGVRMMHEFDFDDFKTNCQIKQPYKFTHEIDLLLLDYQSDLIVAIETTAESSLSKKKIRRKQNSALQFQTFSKMYENLDCLYIYFSTCEEETSSTNSGTGFVLEHWPHIESISSPEDVELDQISSVNAVKTLPSEFGGTFRQFHDGMMDECIECINAFYAG